MTPILIIVGTVGALVLLAHTAMHRGRASGWLERQVIRVVTYLVNEFAPSATVTDAKPEDAKPEDT